MKTLLVVCAFFIVTGVVSAADPTIVWEKTYHMSHASWANDVRVGPDGNIVVLGAEAVTDNHRPYRIVKYNPAGDTLWTRTWDPGDNCWPLGLAVDWLGNCFATGGYNTDCYTVKWDKDGNLGWKRSFDNGADEWAYAAACDPWGNIYVAGTEWLFVKYDPAGTVVRDSAQPWLFGCAYDVATAPDGSVYVGGYSGSNDNAPLMKVDPNGTLLWFYNGVWDSTADFTNGVAVDNDGCAYTTGPSYVPPDGPSAVVTQKFTPDGDTLWRRVYNPGYETSGDAIAVDDHFVYVIGATDNGSGNDLIIIRYLKNGGPAGITVKHWGNDWFYGVASDNAGNFYVSGETDGDWRVVKFHQDDFAVLEKAVVPSGLALEASTVNRTRLEIRYALPASQAGALAIFGPDGRLVQSFPLPPRSSLLSPAFTLDIRSFPAGIYFLRLESGGRSLSRKVVVVR